MKETVPCKAARHKKGPCGSVGSPADINDALIINLRNLSHIMHRLYEGKGSQKRILILLNQSGPVTQRELTRWLGIQPGSASEVIAKLELAGLLVRTPSPADRRTTELSLTDAGKEHAAQAAGQRSLRHRQMFSCLTEEEKQTLLALTDKVYASWKARYLENEEEQ